MDQKTDQMIQRVAIAAVLVMVASVVVMNALLHTKSKAAALGYEVGSTVDIPKSMIGAARTTIVVFARSSCGACQASKSVLKSIAEMVGARQDARIMLIATDGVDQAELAYADDIGVRRADVYAFPVERTRLRVVPTFIVLDGDRTIRHVHQGAQTDAVEMEKIRALLNRG